jgi:putative transposase
MNEISGYMQNQSGYNPQMHNRRSIRLKGYDYSQPGLYFITICCQDKICRFGKIENGEMILNEFGKIAHDEWEKTPQIRPNVPLGEFVIMPNHIHGIIHLDNRRGV